MPEDDLCCVDRDLQGRGATAPTGRHLRGGRTTRGLTGKNPVPGKLQAWSERCKDYPGEQHGITDALRALNDTALVGEACHVKIWVPHDVTGPAV